MPSKYVCSNCRQTLRLRLRQALQNHAQSREWISTHANRPLSTVRILQAAQPQPYQKASTSSASTAPPSSDPKAYPKTPEPSPGSSFSPAQSIARELRKRAGVTTETYVAYGVCETLVKECARQAAYKIPQAQQKNTDIPKTKDGEDLGVGDGWWYQCMFFVGGWYAIARLIPGSPSSALGLTPTFTTWAQVTFLHMYMLTCRLRRFPPAYAPTWHQHLLDHFFFMAEDRMVTQHGIVAGSIRSKYLKDLFVQWRGLTAGYDEGLIKGDAVLATAVWRNLFKADNEVDYRGVGQVVSYMRGVLQGLDGIEDEDIARGEVVFGDPGREKDYVLGKSRMMNMLPESKPKAEI